MPPAESDTGHREAGPACTQRSLHLWADGVRGGVPGCGHAQREPIRRAYFHGCRGAGSRGYQQANQGGAGRREGTGYCAGWQACVCGTIRGDRGGSAPDLSRPGCGGSAQVLPVIVDSQGQGISTLRAIAAERNAREIDAPRGGQWSTVQVQRVLGRSERTSG